MNVNRLHPADLRAIGAFLHSAMEYQRERGVNPVGWTDTLLAELERTAPKAEPEPTPWPKDALERIDLGSAIARAKKSEAERDAAQARVRELEAHLPTMREWDAMKARLAAIEAAREGEPEMPEVNEYAEIVRLEPLEVWGRQGWDGRADAVRVIRMLNEALRRCHTIMPNEWQAALAAAEPFLEDKN